ncbi:acyltransferase [Niallia oryzisoli]|uniref:Acyltransferase n=1 Tax=Niallia oryzisoli TaxID=1737571 RepID=A0ABZ2CDM9_9BACI
MGRILYLDNLRVFLTMLVVVFHTSIAYGGAGSWILKDVDDSQLSLTVIILSIFTGVCQAFFMSLFFFLSTYFIPFSYDKKGPIVFLKGRLIRIGIPLLFYYFIIGPITDWFAHFYNRMTLSQFYIQKVFSFQQNFFGPAWFLETLLYVSIFYALYQFFTKPNKEIEKTRNFPKGKTLVLIAFIFGFIAFSVRMIYPTGTGIWGLQFGYFPLYLLLMWTGVAAYRQKWLENMPAKLIKTWKMIGLVMISIFSVGLIATGALSGNLNFSGGMNTQALFYALWEPFLCFGVSIGLIVYFQKRWNFTNDFINRLRESASTVYLIHPPVIVGWTMAFRTLGLPPFIKFVLVATLSVATCFIIAFFILRVPHMKKIL